MDVVPPPPPPRLGPPPNAFLVGILGLLLPGLGHVVAGRPGKGFFYFCLVGVAFTAGLWMTGLVAVHPERDPLWFAGQALAGLPTVGVWQATKDLVATERLASFDLGMLYTAVAGLLNVVAIADALGIVEDRIAEHDRRRHDAGTIAALGASGRADDDAPVAWAAPVAWGLPVEDGARPVADGAMPQAFPPASDVSRGSGPVAGGEPAS